MCKMYIYVYIHTFQSMDKDSSKTDMTHGNVKSCMHVMLKLDQTISPLSNASCSAHSDYRTCTSCLVVEYSYLIGPSLEKIHVAVQCRNY